MKVLYNVTVSVDREIHNEWRTWMIGEHIPDMMSTGCFEEYKISKIMAGDPNQGISYAIQYVAPSMDVFLDYRDKHSSIMQKKHYVAFKDRYAAFRTLMEILDEG